MTPGIVHQKLLGTLEQQIERSKTFLYLYDVILPIPKVPEFTPQTISEELLLVTYLGDDNGNGELRTRKAWWRFYEPPKGYVKSEWEDYPVTDEDVRMIAGYEYRCGIRWVAYDPLANFTWSPRTCWDRPDRCGHLAGDEVFMAMALSDRYVESWDENTPSPNVAGLRVREAFNTDAGVLYVCRDDKRKVVKLSVVKARETSPCFANPTVRDLKSA